MIRIPANLATEPFRRDRPVIVATVALTALLVAFLGLQSYTVWSERHQAADTRVLLDRLNRQMTAITSEQSKLDATLRRPENAEVLEQSLFLNQLIQHKAISWTKIFSDLDKVMPREVRLMTVRLPQVDTQNQVWLDMTVAAKEPAPVLDLLKRLATAPQFGPASLMTSLPPSQTEPFYRYRVSVSYAQKL